MKPYCRFIIVLIALLLATCQVQATPIATESPAITEADKAQEIISATEKAAQGILGGDDNSYYLAVEYAARDALTRFPNDPRAESWKWKMAYYAILAGDTQIGNDVYIDLINTVLNSRKVDIESLPSWFHPGELIDTGRMPSFELKVNNIATHGNEKKYLINISSFPGGSCFLVVQSSQKYSTLLIYDGFPESGYAPNSYDSLNCTLKDLTNDGNDEIVLENYKGGHVGFTSLRVMDISVTPMKYLPFESNNGDQTFVEYENLKDFPVLNGKNQMRTEEDAPNCQVGLEKTYEWNGNEFVPMDTEFQADAQYAPLKNCLDWSFNYAREVDATDGANIIDQAFSYYKPLAVDEIDNEKLDEIRIDKALLYLFADQPDEMRILLQDVMTNPYQKNGVWTEPIKQFLGTYKNPSDVYFACSKLVACVPSDGQTCSNDSPCLQEAFQYLFNNEFKNIPLTDLVKSLQNAGVNVVSSGWMDFDYDGKDELWFVVVLPDSTDDTELWIATDYPNGISTFQVGRLQSEMPEFSIQLISTGETFVKYSPDWAFVWSRDNTTNEPILEWTIYPDLQEYVENTKLAEIRHELQAGEDPYTLYVEYMNVKKEYGANLAFHYAASYFDFGYIAELVGDKKTATDMYSKLIENFPNHPLAILAKNKLGE